MSRNNPYCAYVSKCNIVHQCGNNHCMFRLRDVYGHTVFWASGPWGKESPNIAVLEEAGVNTPEDIKKLGWPTMKGNPGTNAVYFHCDWYKPLEEEND